MGKRWSKLQSRLYNLMDEKAEFQIHCALYEMNSNDGYHGNKLPWYFITIGKDMMFDYPKQFDATLKYGWNSYPWDCVNRGRSFCHDTGSKVASRGGVQWENDGANYRADSII